MKTNWFDKKIVVLGLSKSGISAAKYLNKKGADVFITESREQKESDNEILTTLKNLGINVEMGGHSEEFLSDVYLAVTSPGIPPHSEVFTKLKANHTEIISEIELASRESLKPFLAITGTNGKTTTTALTAHILNSQFKAEPCGNIGVPPCDLLENKLDYFVCEVSSYQLANCKTFRPQIACWMNFTPDHLDWHQGLENYFDAKARIFKFPQNAAFALFNGKDERLLEFSKTCQSEVFLFDKEVEDNCCFIRDEKIYFKRKKLEEEIISLTECPLVGVHNYQNIMCSIIFAKLVGISNENIKSSIKSFVAPEHRLEYCGKVGKVDCYNDSKATNPESAIVAINSFPDKEVVLIAGGRDKNTDLTEFCEAIKSHIKNVILIGEASQRFDDNLRKSGYENILYAEDFKTSIDKGLELNPDVLLLSPACASFDMFNSFEERGKVFKDYVASKI